MAVSNRKLSPRDKRERAYSMTKSLPFTAKGWVLVKLVKPLRSFTTSMCQLRSSATWPAESSTKSYSGRIAPWMPSIRWFSWTVSLSKSVITNEFFVAFSQGPFRLSPKFFSCEKSWRIQRKVFRAKAWNEIPLSHWASRVYQKLTSNFRSLGWLRKKIECKRSENIGEVAPPHLT